MNRGLLVVGVVLACVAVSWHAPGAPGSEPVQQVPVEDPGLEDQSVTTGDDVESAVGNASQETATTVGPDGVDSSTDTATDATGDKRLESDVTVRIERRFTQWTFDLPLQDGAQETLRFITGDATPRDHVRIDVAWTDRNGTPQTLPEGDQVMVLHMRHGDETHAWEPDHVAADRASFEVPMSVWVGSGSSDWHLEAEVPGAAAPGLDAPRSPYDREGPREAANVRFSEGTPVWVHDLDGDGEPDDRDNCPRHDNPGQADLDGDRAGDVCDADDDGDGWSDDEEQAAGSDPRDPRLTPVDRDGDGFENQDEEVAGSDPDDPASTPEDRDADGFNATVEEAAGSDDRDPASTPTDPDADGIPTQDDVCPHMADEDQADGDGDGIGDACDVEPHDGPDGDADQDGVRNADDVCPRREDPEQADLDGDGLGDACEDDTDGDGFVDVDDRFPRDAAEWRDNDRDGIGDNADPDDDNDGLSDGAEEATGTDPLLADTDGDRYSDADERRMGSDPLDRMDPPYLPEHAEADYTDDGVRITWTPADDPRVAGHVVWEPETHRIVADVTGSEVLDTGNATGYYAIQPYFHDEEIVLDNARAVNVLAVGQQMYASLEAEPTAPAEAAPKEDDTVEAVPDNGVPLPAWVALLAIVWVARRR